MTACAVLTLAAPAVFPASPVRADSQYTFDTQQGLEAGTALDVANVNGRIGVVLASGNEARVSATVRSRRGDARAVKIAVKRVGRTLFVCPVYPGETVAGDCSRHDSNVNDDDDTRVDFTIALPKGVALKARSVNGPIDARNLDSDIDASGVNLKITISTRRTAQAKTVNGAIDATLGARSWNGSLGFKTVNGNVTVRLPRSAAFSLRANALNGGIKVSGFPVAESRGFVGSSANGSTGRGGGELSIKTLNGAIRVDAT
jgi:hypothetical protein